MCASPQHIIDDMESNDDGKDEHLEGDDGIMEFDGLTTMEQSDLPTDGIVGFSETINSLTLMEKDLAQLVSIIQNITNEYKKDNVTLCEHATPHMRVSTCNIYNICLTKVNAILHLRLVLHNVEDGL